MKRNPPRRSAVHPLPCLRTALTAAILLALSVPAVAQEASEQEAKRLDDLVVLGSRAKGHTADETPAPVDVIDRTQMQSTGSLEIGQILQALEPSFNFSRTWISDGTDIIRPATLRALGPDQVLVLVNGKRRHQQALVNVQQTIGRGSAGTDINAIPTAAIERIEVLRDGAAAQYGSDAISGVINIILKDNSEGGDLTVETGKTYEGDGEVVHGGANFGLSMGGAGFMNFTVEYRDRQETNRAGPDLLRVNPPRVTQRIGDADAVDRYFWFNGGADVAEGIHLYWFGGISEREGDSSGFFRSAGDGRTVPQLYPNGFLPNIITEVEDQSLAYGVKGGWDNGWEWDASINHGESEFNFFERNSVNVSWFYEPRPGGGIFGESPTSAYTGSLIFDQTTANVDFRGPVDWGVGDGPLYLATGAEYRRDAYEMIAGDPVSYTYGRNNDPSIIIRDQTGGIAAPGIQGFPGFTPGTEVDESRDNIAVYLDGEANLSTRLLAGAAVRFEDYSDFGNTTTGKISLRFDATEQFALRSTLSTGFRAPGVQQAFYSQVSTNLSPATGVLTDTLTARQDSPVTRALGIDPLKEEESVNVSLGAVWRPNDQFTLTVDVFQIDIDDRIIFSSNIAPEPASACGVNNAGCPIRAILDPFNVGQAQFFTNAIDTRTRGVDIVAEYGWELDGGAVLDLSALLHFNDTEVRERRSQSPILSPEQLFDDTQVTLVEEGQPGEHHVLAANYANGPWNINARANWYGEVSGEGFTPGIKETWSGAWLFDLTVRYAINESTSVAIGGTNIFDEYPDKWDAGVTDPSDPNFNNPFPALGFTYCWETCPFGINGGYYFARLDYQW